MKPKLQLISPSTKYKESYCAYIKELGNEERYPYPMDLDCSDFPKFVALLEAYSQGKKIPTGLVPNSTFWLIQDDEIIACSHLRHELNASLKEAGGHIGLGVRPSKRGLGIGKTLLSLTIQKAKILGINKIHIHCYKDNLASKSLIESSGAKLHSTLPVTNGDDILRYIYLH